MPPREVVAALPPPAWSSERQGDGWKTHDPSAPRPATTSASRSAPTSSRAGTADTTLARITRSPASLVGYHVVDDVVIWDADPSGEDGLTLYVSEPATNANVGGTNAYDGGVSFLVRDARVAEAIREHRHLIEGQARARMGFSLEAVSLSVFGTMYVARVQWVEWYDRTGLVLGEAS